MHRKSISRGSFDSCEDAGKSPFLGQGLAKHGKLAPVFCLWLLLDRRWLVEIEDANKIPPDLGSTTCTTGPRQIMGLPLLIFTNNIKNPTTTDSGCFCQRLQHPNDLSWQVVQLALVLACAPAWLAKAPHWPMPGTCSS